MLFTLSISPKIVPVNRVLTQKNVLNEQISDSLGIIDIASRSVGKEKMTIYSIHGCVFSAMVDKYKE